MQFADRSCGWSFQALRCLILRIEAEVTSQRQYKKVEVRVCRWRQQCNYLAEAVGGGSDCSCLAECSVHHKLHSETVTFSVIWFALKLFSNTLNRLIYNVQRSITGTILPSGCLLVDLLVYYLK